MSLANSQTVNFDTTDFEQKNVFSLFDYRPDIDALRGISVLAVIIFHLNEHWLPGGFTGVDLFFVISGYVVTASLFKRPYHNLGNYLLEFYVRRVKRIFPALIFSTLITACFVALFIPPDEATMIYSDGIASLFGVSNLYFAIKSTDYFGLDQDLNPFTHTWSLGVEEQFYVVFPWLIVLLFHLQSKRKQHNRSILFLLVLICTSAVISFYLTNTNVTRAYYFMPSRFWELLAGCLLFIVFFFYPKLLINQSPFLQNVLYHLSVILIVLGFLFTPAKAGFPFPWAILSVMGGVCFIASGNKDHLYFSGLIHNKLLNYIGCCSYSLYLWHWPVIVLFRWTLGDVGFIVTVAILVLMSIFALVSYYFLEVPIQHLKVKSMPNVLLFSWLTNFSASGLIVLFSFLSPNLFLMQGTTDKLPEKWWPRPCHAKKFDLAEATACLLTPSTTENPIRRLYLIGDSHAANWLYLLQAGSSEFRYLVKDYTIGFHCAYMPAKFISSQVETITNCSGYNDFINKQLIPTLRSQDILILSIARNQLTGKIGDFVNLSPTEQNNLLLAAKPKADEFYGYLASLGVRISQIGGRLVLIGDAPVFINDPRPCIPLLWQSGNVVKDCSVDRELSKRHASAVTDVYTYLTQTNHNISFWNPHDIICPNTRCEPVINRVAMYVDPDHLSKEGSLTLYPFFRKWLNQNRLLN